MQTIVTYPTNALLWHLYNNCRLQQKAVDSIVNVINKLNAGDLTLNSRIARNTDCTVREMLIDLHIEFDEDYIPVKFYREGKDVLAVFYRTEADINGNLLCYSHVGQHSACSKHYLRGRKKATPGQYAPLMSELESMGYKLLVN